MKNILISVIIPIYNAEKYLHKCLKSVLNQDFNDYEIILIDDGSSDNSPKICDEYKKNYPIITVIHQQNQGVSVARNVGIQNAKGKYLCFIDSDDYVEKDYLSKLFSDEADLIVCNNQNSNLKITDCIIENDILNYCLNEKYHKLFLGPVNKLYDLSIIKNDNLKFNNDMSFGEDTYFVISYLKKCKKIKFIDYEGYNIVNVENSLSRGKIKDAYNQIKKVLYLIKTIPTLNKENLNFWKIRCIKTILYCARNENYSIFLSEIKKIKKDKELWDIDILSLSNKNKFIYLALKFNFNYLIFKLYQKM